MSKTQPARGMRDFLPADVRKRNYVINIIKEVYESYGFEPLETPSVENLETLTGKYGEEGNQLIFKILKRGEKLQEELAAGTIKSENELSDLALRYDLTVPLARVVANYRNELPKFFKRYQIQPVWRADRPARGRYREFYQCDVDAIGSNSMLVEAEQISAVCEILRELQINDFEVRLNHRKLLTSILNVSGIPESFHIDTLVALDKLDKIGGKAVADEMIKRGVPLEASVKLMNFMVKIVTLSEISPAQKELLISSQKELSESKNAAQILKVVGTMNEITDRKNERILDQISGYIFQDKDGEQAVSQLEEVIRFANELMLINRVTVDVTLARGLSYYTGAIFEIKLINEFFPASLGGGGRYDGLIGMFGKEQIPACGFSLGLERILVVMEERGMFPRELETSAADVLVTVWNEETAGESLKLANELRKTGLRVFVYPEADKLGKQFKYADSIGAAAVCVLGETELAENTVTVKNLRTGTQETISRAQAGERIGRK